jgi:hypothetical protein
MTLGLLRAVAQARNATEAATLADGWLRAHRIEVLETAPVPVKPDSFGQSIGATESTTI